MILVSGGCIAAAVSVSVIGVDLMDPDLSISSHLVVVAAISMTVIGGDLMDPDLSISPLT